MAHMFLDLDNVTGEAGDLDHLDEIEVYGWTWGLKNVAPLSLRTQGGGTPHGTVDTLTIEKAVDSATVTLVQFCALGTHMPNGYFSCRKLTGDREEVTDYLTIALKDVKVVSIDWPGKAALEEHVATETIVLQFAHFDIAYKKQANEGKLYGKMNFPFDIVEGKAAAPKGP